MQKPRPLSHRYGIGRRGGGFRAFVGRTAHIDHPALNPQAGHADHPAMGNYVDPQTAAQLRAYVEGQGETTIALRERNIPHHPWPELDNPMVRYLIEQGVDKVMTIEDPESAVAWIVAHAWFEGTLDERARVLRALTP